MKVLLELLGDVSQLLTAVDDLESIRPDGQAKMRALIETLHEETGRLLRGRAGEERRETLFGRALEAIAQQRLDEARSILEAAVEIFPEDCELHSHLGLVAWEMSDMEAAADHYGRAMAVGFPDGALDWYDDSNRPFLRAMEGRALALYRLGRNKEALGLFESLASMNAADFAGCRYLAGEIRHGMGLYQEAIADYRLVPTEPAVLYNMGLAYFQLGLRETAAQTLIAAFVSNSHIAHVILRRGDHPETSIPGYLASEAYAEEFVEACGHLWSASSGAVAFLGRCFDHPLVQAHLLQCTRRLMEEVLEMGPAAMREDWLASVAASGSTAIVERILEHMDS